MHTVCDTQVCSKPPPVERAALRAPEWLLLQVAACGVGCIVDRKRALGVGGAVAGAHSRVGHARIRGEVGSGHGLEAVAKVVNGRVERAAARGAQARALAERLHAIAAPAKRVIAQHALAAAVVVDRECTQLRLALAPARE